MKQLDCLPFSCLLSIHKLAIAALCETHISELNATMIL